MLQTLVKAVISLISVSRILLAGTEILVWPNQTLRDLMLAIGACRVSFANVGAYQHSLQLHTINFKVRSYARCARSLLGRNCWIDIGQPICMCMHLCKGLSPFRPNFRIILRPSIAQSIQTAVDVYGDREHAIVSQNYHLGQRLVLQRIHCFSIKFCAISANSVKNPESLIPAKLLIQKDSHTTS